jgi:hypothetical protein
VLSMAFTCTGSAAAPTTPSLLGSIAYGHSKSESREKSSHEASFPIHLVHVRLYRWGESISARLL